MIAYDLICGNGHGFEGWFEDAEAFLDQQRRGLIACPVCSDTAIERLPSRFAIRASQSPSEETEGSDAQRLLSRLQRRIAAYVQAHYEDVGSDFAKEALKIHYGVSEPRNIRGVSTPQEERLLVEEGVSFLKVPLPPSPETDS